jgi:transcriptional regulator
MRAKGADAVGRFAVDFEVANQADIVKARDGLLDQDKVRRTTISGVVDSGATRLVLPERVVKRSNETGLHVTR